MSGFKPITMSLGEVLWDLLPSGRVLGGAPANVAWHAAQLGAKAHVVSAVGSDELGRGILDCLRLMRLNVECVTVLADKPTGTAEARLDERGNASYVINEDAAWDYIPASPEALALAARADVINFGSLGQRGSAGREATHALLDAARPEAIRIFDVNLRFPFIFKEVIAEGLRRATVVKMNDGELPVLADMFDWSGKPEKVIELLLDAYPGVRHAIVTRGGQGVWWHDRLRPHFRLPGRAVKVTDTIGAGDSVTAAAMLGLFRGRAVEDILASALDIASFVCESRGGTPVLPEWMTAAFTD